MSMSGISSALPAQSTYQAYQTQTLGQLGQHKHAGHHSRSLSDIDLQGSSLATAPSATGKIGSKIDITA
jgi:hypothetical protein